MIQSSFFACKSSLTAYPLEYLKLMEQAVLLPTRAERMSALTDITYRQEIGSIYRNAVYHGIAFKKLVEICLEEVVATGGNDPLFPDLIESLDTLLEWAELTGEPFSVSAAEAVKSIGDALQKQSLCIANSGIVALDVLSKRDYLSGEPIWFYCIGTLDGMLFSDHFPQCFRDIANTGADNRDFFLAMVGSYLPRYINHVENDMWGSGTPKDIVGLYDDSDVWSIVEDHKPDFLLARYELENPSDLDALSLLGSDVYIAFVEDQNPITPPSQGMIAGYLVVDFSKSLYMRPPSPLADIARCADPKQLAEAHRALSSLQNMLDGTDTSELCSNDPDWHTVQQTGLLHQIQQRRRVVEDRMTQLGLSIPSSQQPSGTTSTFGQAVSGHGGTASTAPTPDAAGEPADDIPGTAGDRENFNWNAHRNFGL